MRHPSRHARPLAPLRASSAAPRSSRAAERPREAAEQPHHPCDRRILPRNDTLSVEAAARALTGDKAQDIHVSEACIIGTTTSVTLTTPRGPMLCERLQSTWAKRGGWKCDVAEPRHPSRWSIAP